MKQLLKILMASVMLLSISSCNYIKNYDKPHLELINQTPYKLNISNFDWSYGVVAINQFSGDFDKLDEKVYDLLQGKSGSCEVYIELKNIDRYGNSNKTLKYVGVINIDELNKYQDWHYWQRDDGMRMLIYKRILWKQSQNADSTAVYTDTTIHQSAPINQHFDTVIQIRNKVYHFSETMLYPTEEDRKDLDSNRFVVNGVIEDANFLNGVIQVQTNSELLNIQFNPFDLSSDVDYKLRLALANGNHIRSICAKDGASALNLVSCKVTVETTEPLHGDTTKKM